MQYAGGPLLFYELYKLREGVNSTLSPHLSCNDAERHDQSDFFPNAITSVSGQCVINDP